MPFIGTQDVMFMLSVLIKQFGGSAGSRDQSGREAALMHPRSGYYPDLISQAAAFFESLIVSHPLIDA